MFLSQISQDYHFSPFIQPLAVTYIVFHCFYLLPFFGSTYAFTRTWYSCTEQKKWPTYLLQQEVRIHVHINRKAIWPATYMNHLHLKKMHCIKTQEPYIFFSSSITYQNKASSISGPCEICYDDRQKLRTNTQQSWSVLTKIHVLPWTALCCILACNITCRVAWTYWK